MKNLLRSALLLGALAFGLVRTGTAAPATAQPDLVAGYVKISAAFAGDDLKAAKSAANDFAAQATADGKKDLATKATAVARAEKIADARKQFIALSTSIEPLAAGRKEYVVMHCPMANADWVQPTGATANPYYGKMMLTCGAPKVAK
jgi:hypothetical protein